MVKSSAGLTTLFALILLCHTSTFGAVIINEVLANEPGSETSLEWVELYNDGSDSVNLQLCPLNIGGTSVILSGTIGARQYLIICRQLYNTPLALGFESVWGNNSGIWGDTSTENFREPIDTNFSLRNSGDTVTIAQVGKNPMSFIWSNEGIDGRSWELVSADSAEIRQSIDYSGCTPGFVNSISPLDGDLSLDEISVRATEAGSEITTGITNKGTSSAVGRRLLICEMNPAMPDSLGTLVDSVTIPILFGGYTIDIIRTITLNDMYQNLIATVDSDVRSRNNRRAFVASGGLYPPIILSELMTKPGPIDSTEWIELYAVSSVSFNLQDWMIGDDDNTELVTAQPLDISPGDYVVLAEDTAVFRARYFDFSGLLIQPAQWASLDNDRNTVCLIDRYGIVADSFSYTKSSESDRSWCLDESSGQWGQSADLGGSPGQANQVLFEPDDQRISLTIIPQVFSPDGNGSDDVTVITLEAPDAKSYSLKIYDREGRIVRTIIENAEMIRLSYTWDGLSDSGGRLPIGIYICYFEAEGVQAIKKTVVIAR